MQFDARQITLKDGRRCVLRPAVPDDAAALIDYMRLTAGETDFLLRYPDEIRYGIEEEKDLLFRILDSPMDVMMTAEVNGRIAGNSAINGIAGKRKLRHRCSLSIALYREYWGLGIGKAMIGYLTELAEHIGYRQIDLEAVAENKRAIALYTRCGFTESGRRHHALRFDDGSLHDEVLMYKEL